MRLSYWGFIILFIGSACAPYQEPSVAASAPTLEQDLAELSPMRSSFSKTMNEQTVDQWAHSYLAKGATILPSGRPSISSRGEIVAWIRRLLDQYRIEHFQLTTEEVVTGDYTFEKGVYLLEASHQESGEKIQERGKLLFIWRRGAEGRWEGAHVSWNSDGYWP